LRSGAPRDSGGLFAVAQPPVTQTRPPLGGTRIEGRRGGAVLGGLKLAPLVVHRHAHELSDGRRIPRGRRRSEAEVVEDARDGQLVGDLGHDLERTSADFAHDRIGREHLPDQPLPNSANSAAGGGGLGGEAGRVCLAPLTAERWVHAGVARAEAVLEASLHEPSLPRDARASLRPRGASGRFGGRAVIAARSCSAR
jgi:hypothetical protein